MMSIIDGGMFALHTTTGEEKRLLQKLEHINRQMSFLRDQLRQGFTLKEESF
ncbi:MAG: hypothetical protein KBG91_07140 [Syntrophomonadaceae bacterium]|nr:hypothetical protein [Syntrophomonadaceae bacterium]